LQICCRFKGASKKLADKALAPLSGFFRGSLKEVVMDAGRFEPEIVAFCCEH
jgi:hypothetical protein